MNLSFAEKTEITQARQMYNEYVSIGMRNHQLHANPISENL